MSYKSIDWDKVPDIITKEQFWKLCHISKATARYLLQSGKIPCIYSGKKTRCYQILKKDVMAYVMNRELYPEYYSAAKGDSRSTLSDSTIIQIRKQKKMHEYYAFLLKKYPDVLDTLTISNITGYGKTAVNNWCQKERIQHFKINGRYMVPKVYLIDFFCSTYFRTIKRKSEWHVKTLI